MLPHEALSMRVSDNPDRGGCLQKGNRAILAILHITVMFFILSLKKGQLSTCNGHISWTKHTLGISID